MSGRLPFDAFDYYLSLGPNRSYQAVAEKYGVTKRAVVDLAKREQWQRQITDIEAKVRESANQKAVETLEEMADRHLKVCRVIQHKALEALKSVPLSTAMEAIRALDLSIKQERVIRGEPGDRTAVSTEEIVRREYDRWLVNAGDDEESGDACADR